MTTTYSVEELEQLQKDLSEEFFEVLDEQTGCEPYTVVFKRMLGEKQMNMVIKGVYGKRKQKKLPPLKVIVALAFWFSPEFIEDCYTVATQYTKEKSAEKIYTEYLENKDEFFESYEKRRKSYRKVSRRFRLDLANLVSMGVIQ